MIVLAFSSQDEPFLHYFLNDSTAEWRKTPLVYFCKVSRAPDGLNAAESNTGCSIYMLKLLKIFGHLRLWERPDLKMNHSRSVCQADVKASDAGSERSRVATDYTGRGPRKLFCDP